MLAIVLMSSASQIVAQENSTDPQLTEEQKREIYEARRDRAAQARQKRDTAKREKAAALIMERAAAKRQ